MARPREFDEQTVVQEAMHVFWRKGYQATSVRDLVEATGLQRGSLYGAFGDKHGLFMASLAAYGDMAIERFREMVREADDPVEALRTFIRMGAEDCIGGPLVARGCMVGNTCTELAADDAVAREQVTVFMGRMQHAMADALREGQRRGTFARDRDPEVVATFVQCGLQGLTVLAKANPGEAKIRAVAQELVRALD